MSKAFYRVDHTTLFKQLGARGIPGYILRILIYWYKNQDMCIRWGDAYSAKFKVTNGVRQGGILSPYLFNVYVDELSEELNKCNVGCNLNGLLINHIMYADDLVLISPSSAGLSQLLRECEKFGTRHDVKYNAKKSAVMIYRSMTLKGCRPTIPNFNLNGLILHVVASYKYIGHYITDDLSDDDDDINRQRRTLFVQGNIILRKFNVFIYSNYVYIIFLYTNLPCFVKRPRAIVIDWALYKYFYYYYYLFLGCETHTLSYLLFTYVYSTTLVELQKIYHY